MVKVGERPLKDVVIELIQVNEEIGENAKEYCKTSNIKLLQKGTDLKQLRDDVIIELKKTVGWKGD